MSHTPRHVYEINLASRLRLYFRARSVPGCLDIEWSYFLQLANMSADSYLVWYSNYLSPHMADGVRGIQDAILGTEQRSMGDYMSGVHNNERLTEIYSVCRHERVRRLFPRPFLT